MDGARSRLDPLLWVTQVTRASVHGPDNEVGPTAAGSTTAGAPGDLSNVPHPPHEIAAASRCDPPGAVTVRKHRGAEPVTPSP